MKMHNITNCGMYLADMWILSD